MAIITISRGTFSGGKDLAETVARKLDYNCVSREQIIKSAAEFGIPERTLTNVLVKAPTFWDRYKDIKRRYLALAKYSVLEEAIRHNIVYHGHAGHYLFPEHYWTLKVKLTAAREYRIEQIMIKQNLSRDEAIQYIFDIDNTRKKWSEFLHGIDWDDPSLYDLVLNIQVMDIDTASDAVVALAQGEPFRPSEISDKIIRQLFLAAKVEVALIKNKKTSRYNISVESHEDGIIELKGKIDDKAFIDAIEDVAGKVEGVKEINYR
jgi:cytidylate kinase